MVSFSAASGIEFLVRRRARFFRYNFAYSALGFMLQVFIFIGSGALLAWVYGFGS